MNNFRVGDIVTCTNPNNIFGGYPSLGVTGTVINVAGYGVMVAWNKEYPCFYTEGG